jgi:hypothetical protein
MKNAAKKRLFFKKVTIANLNQDEMNDIRGGCLSLSGCPKMLDTRDTLQKVLSDTC